MLTANAGTTRSFEGSAFLVAGLVVAVLTGGILFASGYLGLAAAGPAAGDRDTTITDWVVLPVLFHTPETGTGGGIAGAYYRKYGVEAKPSSFAWTAFYTEKKQTILAVESKTYLSGGTQRVLVEMEYEDFPNTFYGLGSGTAEDDSEDYREKSLELELAYERELTRGVRVGPRLGFRRSHVTEVEEDGQLAGGRIRGVDLHRNTTIGLVLVYDARDNIVFTTNGTLVALSTNYSGDLTGSDFSYSKHTIDLRRFFGWGSRQAIGLRAYFSAAGGSPPFQSMPSLGGAEAMRGFAGGRFRDRLAYIGQAEYRLKLKWRLGFAAFAALGDVADRLEDFEGSGVKYSGGAGLRIRLSDEGLNLRLDLGFTDEGSGFYFVAGEAF